MPDPTFTPGTTPAGSEPQDDGTGNPNNNPNPGAPPRLIAGKFKTVEEAVEHGYQGLERGYHQLSEQVGALTRVMEAALTPDPRTGGYSRDPAVGGVPIGSGGTGRGDDYGRRPDPDQVDAAQFLANPQQVLAQREERMLNRVGDLVGNVVANAMAVQEFKSRNPDLAPHERVVQTFMRDLDPRQYRTVGERLEQAGKMARNYLTSVRAGPHGVPNTVPQGGTYVEPPTGNAAPAYTPPGANPDGSPMGGNLNPANQVSSEEKELLDYIAERNANLNASFGIKPT